MNGAQGFRCSLGLLVLALLPACTRPPNPPPEAAPPPPDPAWSVAEPARWTVRAVGRESLPEAEPERLLRDLADALACELARETLARRAGEALRAKGGMDSVAARSARLQAAIRRNPAHGCAIARRVMRLDKAGRRWCWSEAVLDSAEVHPLLDREWKRLDPRAGPVPDGLLD